MILKSMQRSFSRSGANLSAVGKDSLEIVKIVSHMESVIVIVLDVGSWLNGSRFVFWYPDGISNWGNSWLYKRFRFLYWFFQNPTGIFTDHSCNEWKRVVQWVRLMT